MTRLAVREYVDAVRARYLRSSNMKAAWAFSSGGSVAPPLVCPTSGESGTGKKCICLQVGSWPKRGIQQRQCHDKEEHQGEGRGEGQ
jgi:hypothetical protein